MGAGTSLSRPVESREGQPSPKPHILAALKPAIPTNVCREGSRVHRPVKERRHCSFIEPERDPIRVRRQLAPCPLPEGINKKLLEDARVQSNTRLRAKMRFQAAIRIVLEQQRARKGKGLLPADGRFALTNEMLGITDENNQDTQGILGESCFEFFRVKAKMQQLSNKFSPQAISPDKLLALRREFDEADSKRRYVTN
jgi:hypothetical protein